MQLQSFVHFRAIAILFIVAGHSFGMINIQPSNLINGTLFNPISGGTSLFVFISGFLFHHVFIKNFNYTKFLKKKTKKILIPYLILGAIPVYFYASGTKDAFGGVFLPDGDGVFNQYIIPTIKYYLSGRFITAYWYIPFIMCIFLTSPLHVLYSKKKTSTQLAIICILSIISILIHRPIANINLIQSLVYFTPVYLIGISTSINRKIIYEKLKNKEPTLLLIVIFLAFTQATLGHYDSYHKQPLDYSGLDLMFIQKLVLCFFFMIWLHRFENINNRISTVLASTSFAIYFVHPFVLWILNKSYKQPLATESWLTYIIFVPSLIIFCIITAKTIKRTTPKLSGYLIGYS